MNATHMHKHTKWCLEGPFDILTVIAAYSFLGICELSNGSRRIWWYVFLLTVLSPSELLELKFLTFCCFIQTLKYVNYATFSRLVNCLFIMFFSFSWADAIIFTAFICYTCRNIDIWNTHMYVLSWNWLWFCRYIWTVLTCMA